jgi:hypothetical protein
MVTMLSNLAAPSGTIFRTVDLTQQKTGVHVALIYACLREPLQAAMVRRRKSDVRDRGIVHDMPPCLGFPRGSHTPNLFDEGRGYPDGKLPSG